LIERKYDQRQLGEGFIRDSIDDCWEPWMKIADEILDDEELIEPVYEALRRRRPKSATRGRKGTPAEVALRMLALKHMRNWSFDFWNAKSAPISSIEFSRASAPRKFRMRKHWRESRVLWDQRCFRRYKLESWESQRKRRPWKVAKCESIRRSPKRTSITQPTAACYWMGCACLTRTMKRIVEIGGKAGEQARDRMRSVGRRVMEIARITRTKGQKQTKEKLQASYKRLLNATGQVVAQAKRIADEVKKGVKKSRTLVDQLRLEALQSELERMIPLVRQVMRQTKARVFTMTCTRRTSSSACLRRRHKSSAKASHRSRPSSAD